MVYIFYTCYGKRLNNNTFNYYLKKTSILIWDCNFKLHTLEDAQRSLLKGYIFINNLIILFVNKLTDF